MGEWDLTKLLFGLKGPEGGGVPEGEIWWVVLSVFALSSEAERDEDGGIREGQGKQEEERKKKKKKRSETY